MSSDGRSRFRPWLKEIGDARRLALFGAIAIFGAAFWLVGPWAERMLFAPDFKFVELKEPAGFRSIGTGDFSSGLAPLAGVGGASDGIGSQDVGLDGRRLCRALFGGEPAEGLVPIAYFSDYNCPYCRVLSEDLAVLEEELPDEVRIAWHEWPVFGRPSELAARAALAAKRQDAYAAFHRRLIRTAFVPTPAYLRSISEDVGIDADRLLEDMQAAAVDEEIAQARALAAVFGFPGTPGLVVGRTVVVGAISEAELRALVDRERVDGPIPACQ